MRDLDKAQHWFRHSLRLRTDSDQLGRAIGLAHLGRVAVARFDDAQRTGAAGPVLLEHLSAALRTYQQSLDLTSADNHQTRAVAENLLGNAYKRAGDTRQALRHYQRSIQHNEAREDTFGAREIRQNIALLLADDGLTSDAMHYARAALQNYPQAGPGAATNAAAAERLIAVLKQRSS